MHPSGEFRPPRWASIQRSPLVLVMLMGLCAATANGEPTTMTRQLPFALTSVTLYDHASDGVFSACFDRIQAILDRFNMYSSASEISQVNRTAAQKAVVVSDDFRDALGQALRLSQLTDGMFDPTVGPLVKLWKIGSDDAHVPSPQEIASALRLVGWKDVIFDEKARTVSFRRPGMALDFGAVLKGFSAVQAGQVLAAHGVKSAVVDIGGSVMTLGTHPDGSPWRIGIQKPGAPPGTSLGIVEVRDEVVNTSGTYEQFFVQNGRRYQHIFNPHTGYPVDNGIESVSVIANRLHNADGPTLSILATGVRKGLALAAEMGIDAIIINDDRTIDLTPGLRGRFTLSDSSYRIVSP